MPETLTYSPGPNLTVCGNAAVPITTNFNFADYPNGSVLLINTAMVGAISGQLPTPVRGRVYTVKDIAGNLSVAAFTAVRAATEKIEGVAASYVMSENRGERTFVCDGTDWDLLSTRLASATDAAAPVALAGNASTGQTEIRPVSIATFPAASTYLVRLTDGAASEVVQATGTTTVPWDHIILSTPIVGNYGAGPGTVTRLASLDGYIDALARTKLDGIAPGADVTPAATVAVAGRVELATVDECDTGTDTARAVTPDSLKQVLDQPPFRSISGATGTITIADSGAVVWVSYAGTCTLTMDAFAAPRSSGGDRGYVITIQASNAATILVITGTATIDGVATDYTAATGKARVSLLSFDGSAFLSGATP